MSFKDFFTKGPGKFFTRPALLSITDIMGLNDKIFKKGDKDKKKEEEGNKDKKKEEEDKNSD